MAKKKITIDGLAVMVKRRFDQTVTKEEFHREIGRVKEELHEEIGGVKSEVKEMRGQIARLAADISWLKEETHRDNPFAEDLLSRMREVEKRVGIKK